MDTPIGANSRLFQQLVHCEQEDESASETGSDKNIQVLLLSPGVLFFHLYRPALLCDTVHANANANESWWDKKHFAFLLAGLSQSIVKY